MKWNKQFTFSSAFVVPLTSQSLSHINYNPLTNCLSLISRDDPLSQFFPATHIASFQMLSSSFRPRELHRRRSRANLAASNHSNINRRSLKSSSPRRKNGGMKHGNSAKRQSQLREAKTMGEAIQTASTIEEYLSIVDRFVWLPTDKNLPHHLLSQVVHHDRRRRWGSQLLEGLGQAALNMWENDSKQIFCGRNAADLWRDGKLTRVISSVALGDNCHSLDRREKESAWIMSALKGLHMLSACISPVAPSQSSSLEEMELWIITHERISSLIQSADLLFSDERSLLKDAIEIRWAIRGLVSRLQMANSELPNLSTNSYSPFPKKIFDFATPNLNFRSSKLPFDILPHCLPWQMHSSSQEYYGYVDQRLVLDLLQTIPFNFDTLTTRTGDSVIERRGTAWLAENGIGSLAYSGKLMKPNELPDLARNIMREVEQWCSKQGHNEGSSFSLLESSQIVDWSSEMSSFFEFKWDDYTSCNLPYQELGQFLQDLSYDALNLRNPHLLTSFFDCALCNHYPDGDSACKFHTDPEHGTHWHRTTAVVSCGTSRKFAFRPIPGISNWSEWETIVSHSYVETQSDISCAPAAIHLFPGDVVFMTGVCNDLFHHAVFASSSDQFSSDSCRVSLVFKKALDRGGGKKGHGSAGEGRRFRRKNV